MRYSNETIEDVWSEKKTISIRIRIEYEWLYSLHCLGIVGKPPFFTDDDLGLIFDRSREVEKLTNHDVASFVIALEDVLISKRYEDHRMTHFGLTSSDICDTSLSIAYKESFDFISNELRMLVSSLFDSCKEFKVVARTHGASTGVEIPFNRRLSGLANELLDALKLILGLDYYGKLSGPVGLSDAFKDHKRCEQATLSRFSLDTHSGSTQIIPRHVYAEYHLKMAILGKILSRIANSIRLSILAGDISISRITGEVGSSSMPHKINPWQLERVIGMSRMLDAHAMTALSNIDLWMERDISHSCVERQNPRDGFNYLVTMIRDIKDFLPKISKGVGIVGCELNTYKALNEMVIDSRGKTRQECHKEVENTSVMYSCA